MVTVDAAHAVFLTELVPVLSARRAARRRGIDHVIVTT